MHTLQRLLEAQEQVKGLYADGFMGDDDFEVTLEYIGNLIEDVYEEEKEEREAQKLSVTFQ
ncbi:hypothetical protein [Bacillus wiedmannii]|uniref:hypothetical protein n=1 Tax=Bacillus wiedmannii TaxID=1890302 RepID=UPI000BFC0D2C|nr:hypothetical protein [Bacillus wiedmannii]PHF95454.1 hypothetical protein COI45_07410 [Bacillus wiedmannii]HDR7780191.1 hypothetical protein [Bacillus wiedmannii]